MMRIFLVVSFLSVGLSELVLQKAQTQVMWKHNPPSNEKILPIILETKYQPDRIEKLQTIWEIIPEQKIRLIPQK